ncbi:hypothetical protein BDW74DRAFT_176680 [Aspergillus multicolor]|uniref:cell wall mannoprotein 1 family protein n=1 Tax=Aspergillus multicolor TaxID=41759 RepID=UPI003CCD602A
MIKLTTLLTRISTLLTGTGLGTITGVLASPASVLHGKRTPLDYEQILSTVLSQIEIAGLVLRNYRAGAVLGITVQTEARVVVDLINTSSEQVATLDPISYLDAMSLVSPITSLTDEVGVLTNELIAAKPNFTTDELKGEVLSTLYDFRDAGERLRDAITAKTPAALRGVANPLADRVVADVQRTIDAYSD